MEKLNFREWLAGRGVLLEYVRNRVADREWSNDMSPKVDMPYGWIDGAFWFSRMGQDVNLKWIKLSGEWSEALDGGCAAVPGMPFNDKLGMTLLLAELEADNG